MAHLQQIKQKAEWSISTKITQNAQKARPWIPKHKTGRTKCKSSYQVFAGEKDHSRLATAVTAASGGELEHKEILSVMSHY